MINHTQPLDISTLTEEQINSEIEKGYADILVSRTKPAEKVFAEVRKNYDISN